MIRYQDDDVVHEECYSEEESSPNPRKPIKSCPNCFQVHAGECL